jgi:hypothetical protein
LSSYYCANSNLLVQAKGANLWKIGFPAMAQIIVRSPTNPDEMVCLLIILYHSITQPSQPPAPTPAPAQLNCSCVVCKTLVELQGSLAGRAAGSTSFSKAVPTLPYPTLPYHPTYCHYITHSVIIIHHRTCCRDLVVLSLVY